MLAKTGNTNSQVKKIDNLYAQAIGLQLIEDKINLIDSQIEKIKGEIYNKTSQEKDKKTLAVATQL